MRINANIIDKEKYEEAKTKANKVYAKPSAYKSMFIQKIYKELGGRYKNGSIKTSSTTRWNKELWIQVIPYLKTGAVIACGKNNKKTKVCRPLKRINKNTPITIGELLKLHSKQDLIKLANKKNRNMSGRVYWKTLKFVKARQSSDNIK